MHAQDNWRDWCNHSPSCTFPDECNQKDAKAGPLAFTCRVYADAPNEPPLPTFHRRWHFSVLLTLESGEGRSVNGTRFTRAGALQAALAWVDAQLRQVRG